MKKHFSYLLTKYACQVFNMMSEVQTLSQTSLSHYIFSQWQWQKEKKEKKRKKKNVTLFPTADTFWLLIF